MIIWNCNEIFKLFNKVSNTKVDYYYNFAAEVFMHI